MDAIQQLRRHRNELAHHLVNKLHNLQIASHSDLFGRVDVAIFKLSNYRAYIEIGSDPEFKNLVPDWSTLKGQEYVIFESVRDKLKLFG
jgi:DNA helicase IV